MSGAVGGVIAVRELSEGDTKVGCNKQDKQSCAETNQQKAKKKASKAESKSKKLELETAWKKLKDDHRMWVDAWKAKVDCLKALGKRGSDLPDKPPKLIIKAKFAEQYFDSTGSIYNGKLEEDSDSVNERGEGKEMDAEGETMDWDSDDE
ncbi:hypothetical protein M422DRAFT_254798 [Sphaerobolus stellatus SS14]|uniref:Uncharacterized protein n=1 Tax=Sphaerobolus stellatus (strain SS14) TaxID=990650 RepID=A0A0C9VV00_SPHS4|nr:hypothetical protein M422DRAFT_254798 [Sphaerobolus stellatus SS14]